MQMSSKLRKGDRVRLNEEWGRWAPCEVRKQLNLFRPTLRGWPVGTKATVVGFSAGRCIRIVKDGGKTPTSFNIQFLDVIRGSK